MADQDPKQFQQLYNASVNFGITLDAAVYWLALIGPFLQEANKATDFEMLIEWLTDTFYLSHPDAIRNLYEKSSDLTSIKNSIPILVLRDVLHDYSYNDYEIRLNAWFIHNLMVEDRNLANRFQLSGIDLLVEIKAAGSTTHLNLTEDLAAGILLGAALLNFPIEMRLFGVKIDKYALFGSQHFPALISVDLAEQIGTKDINSQNPLPRFEEELVVIYFPPNDKYRTVSADYHMLQGLQTAQTWFGKIIPISRIVHTDEDGNSDEYKLA